MIIDGHSHITLPIEQHIQLMDNAGIDQTILFSTTFHPELSRNFTETKHSMEYLNELLAGNKGDLTQARKNANIELVSAIQQYPERFKGFGSVPIGLDKKETLKFVKDYIVEKNLIGMGEFTLSSNQIPTMESVFLASMELNNLPIWIHALYPLDFEGIKKIYELAKLYPNTPVILGHLGGFHWLKTMELVKELPNLYLDTSAFYSTFVLQTIINELPEKCIFGVDLPFGDLELSKNAIIKYAKSSEIVQAVFYETICTILDL
jgi:uncharacterized protein